MRAIWYLGLFAIGLTSSGCAAAALGGAAGAASVAYIVGENERTYPVPLDVVWDAAQAALDELELSRGPEAKDQLKGHIERYTATGDRLRIEFTRIGPSTKIKLRINTFGNETMARTVLYAVERNLPGEVHRPELSMRSEPTSLPVIPHEESDEEGPVFEPHAPFFESHVEEPPLFP